MNNTKSGSIWRKWDLHVHSKFSQESQAKLEILDIFKSAIEKDIEVIAITDHSNVDSLDEIWNIWETQSVKIDGKDVKISDSIEFLPGCELKTNMGKHGVHIVTIFPKEIDGSKVNKNYLELQFLSKINCSRQDVTNKGNGDFAKGIFQMAVDFEGTAKIIRDLGGLIIVHAGEKSNGIEKEMSHARDEADSYQLLNSLGVKKTELMEKFIDICELPNSNKKSLIESKFYLDKFNKPSILSSDSHETYGGSVFTWIKADPTFWGLKQITYEPKERVYIGQAPPLLDRVRSNKIKYIKTLNIDQIKGYDESQGVWFKDVQIPLNSELVAIIGNKGSGKSAIADIIGLLGNTKNAGEKNSNFSFLNEGKFKKRGYAENFKAELSWKDDIDSPATLLNNEIDHTQVERIRYLPQNYFETLTNSLNGESFEKTLRDVIFLNIPESDRLGLTSFDELEKSKKRNIEIDIVKLKDELRNIISKIIKLESRNHPDYIAKLGNLISEKKKELKEHDKVKPTDVENPSRKTNAKPDDEAKKKQLDKLTKLNGLQDKLSSDIAQKNQELVTLKQSEEKLKSISVELNRFSANINDLKDVHKKDLAALGIDLDKIINLKIDLLPIKSKLAGIQKEIRSTSLLLSTASQIESDISLTKVEKENLINTSLINQRVVAKKQIGEIKDVLSKPEKDFQEYKEKLLKWENKRKGIEGIEANPDNGTLFSYKVEREFITTKLQPELKKLSKDRIDKSIEIFNKKKEILDLYNSLKQSIDQQLVDRTDLADKFKIEINSGFDLQKEFAGEFLNYINKTKSGTFRSASEPKVLELFKDKDLTNDTDVQSILNDVILLLNEDRSENIEETKRQRHVSDQIANVQDFYEFVFSLDYLLPVYDLKLDDKKLVELSPGERGALLLVFYLIIDKEDIPLLIDQPEDNLDNKSVFEILTHFIKIAKSRRQIIIVTHNPNLAVGADAEQIIYVEIEKRNKCSFVYETGGIENPQINNRIVEILEGTMPAFEKRELKYMKVPKKI